MCAFFCKYAIFLNLFFPLLCSAETASLVSSNTEVVSMVAKKSQFPIQVFDLNSKEQVESLYKVWSEREDSVKNQSELGIYGIFSVRTPEDVRKIVDVYDSVAFALSVLEIRFMNQIKIRKYVPIHSGLELDIVLSGASDTYIDITGISFSLSANSIFIHNLKWRSAENNAVLTVGVKKSLIVEHVAFTDNQYDDYYAPIAEPRFEISAAYAEDGPLATATFRHLTFKNNKAASLLAIADDYIDKFGTITFDHLTLTDNKTSRMGIDVSAAQKTVITNAVISGHTGSPALVQRTPLGQVEIRDSKIPDDAYQYVPLPKYKGQTAKPVKK